MRQLAVAWCTMFVIGTDLFVISPLLPQIAGDLRLAPASAGLGVTAFAAAYMICAPLLGHFSDRIGRRGMLSGCLVGFAVANLLTASAPDLVWLIAARVLAGITTAGISPSIYALVGESAPPARRATWMATAVSGLLMSLSFGAPLGALAGAALGWSKVFDMLAGFALLLVLANRWVWPSLPLAAPATGASGEAATAGRIARHLLPTVIWATALYGMYTYLGTWLARLGYSTEAIAQIITCYGVGALVGTFAGGRIADRIGARTATAVSLLGLSACFMLLSLVVRPGWPIGIGIGALSAVAQIFFPAQQAGLVADFPDRRATVLAWNNSSLFLGIALGSLVGGQAIAHASFAVSLVVCGAIALAGWLVNRLVAAGRRSVAA